MFTTTPDNDITALPIVLNTVANGLNTRKKKRRGTKKCACGRHAGNNKQKKCTSCGSSNWLKPQKKMGIRRGLVCPRDGCNWSTTGNRTLLCGSCSFPFPSAAKRKGYKKKNKRKSFLEGDNPKKKKKKTKMTANTTAAVTASIRTEPSMPRSDSFLYGDSFLYDDSLLDDESFLDNVGVLDSTTEQEKNSFYEILDSFTLLDHFEKDVGSMDSDVGKTTTPAFLEEDVGKTMTLALLEECIGL